MGQLQLAPGCAREYETIYIMRPAVDKETADGVANRVHDAIKGTAGTVTDVELWGRRRLSYQIQRHHRGIYVYLKYLGRGETVSELERQLKLIDEVIRFQTIVLRNNVPAADQQATEMDLGFDLVDEPDEPELTLERELGLDNIQDRRRERDRDRRRDDDEGAAAADQKNDNAKSADGADKAPEAKSADGADKAPEAKSADGADKAPEAKSADGADKAPEAKSADGADKAPEAKSADGADKAPEAKNADDAKSEEG